MSEKRLSAPPLFFCAFGEYAKSIYSTRRIRKKNKNLDCEYVKIVYFPAHGEYADQHKHKRIFRVYLQKELSTRKIAVTD